MRITSMSFVLCAAALVVLYYRIPKKWQWAALLCASLGFYAAGGLRYAGYILMTAASTYAATLAMGRVSQKQKAYFAANRNTLTKAEKSEIKKKNNRKKKGLMVAALVLNFGILCVFKYFHFALEQLNHIFTLFGGLQLKDTFTLLVPLGISFYTFQTMGYLVDVYWGKVEPERNFGKLLLFVSFFPQITQGPISSFAQLAPQFTQPHSFTYENYAGGCQRMIWGFFKKMVVADQLAVLIVDPVYLNLENYQGGALVLATCAFAFQIYCDFGGYSDIARGCAKMMGVDLMVNFKSPYFFSHSIGNYWQRNHVSLSQWFTEYVYIPLGGSRKGRMKQYWFTTITFFLSGLWHGAEWSFVVWGLLQAVYLNLERLFHRPKEPPKSPPLHLLAIVTTFALSCFSLIFFRAANIGEALYVVRNALWDIGTPALYWTGLMTNLTGPEALGLGMREAVFLLGALLLLFLYDLADERTDAIAMVSRWPAAVRWGCYLGLVMIVLIFGVYGPGYDVRAFAYFDF